MTKENIIRLYKHFTFLAAGKFTQEDFLKEYGEGDDAGRDSVGKLTADRKRLIISDAKRNIIELEKKHSFLKGDVKPLETKPKAKK